jgi:hypothetical protein
MKKILALLTAAAGALALAIPATAGVSPGTAIYVDGVGYRTVGTPTDFSGTGAPDSTFQPIYKFVGDSMGDPDRQPSVATAAPGDPGFRGGRWKVYAVTFPSQSAYEDAVDAYDTNDSGNFDSWTELHNAVMDGVATVTDTGIRFECPLIPLPRHG